MAELAFIGGIGLAGNILVQGGGLIVVGGTVYRYKEIFVNYFSYRFRILKAKKMIKKGIRKVDYSKFKRGFTLLENVDRLNNGECYLHYLKKYNLTEDIINDIQLFKMKFDGVYLTEKMKNIYNKEVDRHNSFDDLDEDNMKYFKSKKEELDKIINMAEIKYSDTPSRQLTFTNINSDTDEEINFKKNKIDECIKKIYSF